MSQNLPAVSAMMSGIITTDQNDPAIKLFGRTIENSAFVYESPPSAFSKIAGNSVPESAADAVGAGSCRHNSLHHHGSSLQSSNGSADVEKPITRVVDIPSSSVHAQDEGHDDVAHGNSEDHTHSHASDKALKRPDKPVPCPRCKSLDTKFCYYNNYNVNQPRHFCKHCQRYWTAGGSLRNLPVGAGRRKNKLTEVLHQRRFPTDGMAVRGDPPDHAQQVLASAGVVSPLALNKHINMRPPSCSQYFLPLEAGSLSRAADNPSSSTVLSFKHESSLCGSTHASLHQHRAEVFQGYAQEPHGQERLHPKVEAGPLAYVNAPVDMGGNKACDGNPSQEQIPFRTATGIGHEVSHQPIGKPVSTYVGTPESQMPISTDLKPDSATFNDMPNHDAAHGWGPGTPFPFMGSPWQYAGNTAWANSLTATALATALQGPWGPYSNTICANPSQTAAVCVNQPPWSAALGAFWAGFPWPLMQSPLWGPPGAWTMPWTPAAAAATAAAAAIAAAATAANANTAGNPMLASPATGKREREQAQPADSGKQGSLLVPKLLRIDDPGEAVRSSIWATLGIDKRSDSLGSGGIFGAFQPKAGSKEGNNTHAQAWYSNPAALTRSSAFQEGATQNVNVHGE